MYRRFSATVVLIGSLLVGTPQFARAQTAEIKRAALACDSKDWEARIAGCARLINSSAKASLKLIAYQQRGYGYLMNGQFDLALADYNHVIELNPKSAGAYVDRAAAYLFIGSDDGVIDSAEQAVKLDPKLARAYFARAQGYSAKREYSISQTGISATGILRRPIMTGPTFISKRVTSISLSPISINRSGSIRPTPPATSNARTSGAPRATSIAP